MNVGIACRRPWSRMSMRQDVVFHSENGIIGIGPELDNVENPDNDLLSAGKAGPLMPWGSFVHHADSALARGGGSTRPSSAPSGGRQWRPPTGNCRASDRQHRRRHGHRGR